MLLKFLFLSIISCFKAQNLDQPCVYTRDCDTTTISRQIFSELYSFDSRPISEIILSLMTADKSLLQIFRGFVHEESDGTNLYKIIFVSDNGFYEAELKLMRNGSTILQKENRFQKMENEKYYSFNDPKISQEINQMFKQNRTLANLQILDAFISEPASGQDTNSVNRNLRVFLLGPTKNILEVKVTAEIFKSQISDSKNQSEDNRLDLNNLDSNIGSSLIILRTANPLISNSRLIQITEQMAMINRTDYFFTTPQKIYTAFFEINQTIQWIKFFIVINIRANPIVIARSPALERSDQQYISPQPEFDCLEKQERRQDISAYPLYEYPQSRINWLYSSNAMSLTKTLLYFCSENKAGSAAQADLLSGRQGYNSSHTFYKFIFQLYNKEQEKNSITVIMPLKSSNQSQDFQVNQFVIDLLSQRFEAYNEFGLSANEYSNQSVQFYKVFYEVQSNLKASHIPIDQAPLVRLYTYNYLRDGIQSFRRICLQYRFTNFPMNQQLKEFTYDRNRQTKELTFLHMTNLHQNYVPWQLSSAQLFIGFSPRKDLLPGLPYLIISPKSTYSRIILIYFERGVLQGVYTNSDFNFFTKIPNIKNFLGTQIIEEGDQWFQTKLSQLPLPYDFAMQYVRSNPEVSKLIRLFEADLDIGIKIFNLSLRGVELVNVTQQQYWFMVRYSNGQQQFFKDKHVQATLIIPRYDYIELNVSYTVHTFTKFGILGEILTPRQLQEEYPDYISTFIEQIYRDEEQGSSTTYYKFKDGSIYRYVSSSTLQAVKQVKDFKNNEIYEIYQQFDASVSQQEIQQVQILLKQLGFPNLNIKSVNVKNSQTYTGIRLLYLEIETRDSRMYDMIYKRYEGSAKIIPLFIKSWEFWHFSPDSFRRCQEQEYKLMQRWMQHLFKGGIMIMKAFIRQLPFDKYKTRQNYLLQIFHKNYGRFEVLVMENDGQLYDIYSVIHMDAGFSNSGISLTDNSVDLSQIHKLTNVEQETRKKLDQFFLLVNPDNLQDKFKNLLLWKIVTYSTEFCEAEFYYDILETEYIVQVRVTKYLDEQIALIFFKMIPHELRSVVLIESESNQPPRNMRYLPFLRQCEKMLETNYQRILKQADLVNISENVMSTNLISFDFIYQTIDKQILKSTAYYDLSIGSAKLITIQSVKIRNQVKVDKIPGCINVDANWECELCDSRYFYKLLGFCSPSLFRCAIKSDNQCIQCLFGYTRNMFSDLNKCGP